MAARTQSDPRRSVEDALIRLGASISDARDQIAAREGTSPVGADLLLAVRDPRPQGSLAEELGLSEPRLSVLATRLVERKLLRRRTTKGDKRFRILELTAAGRAAATRIEKGRDALAPLGALSDAQVKQLGRLLAAVQPPTS
jgi:DNA-binding MarR family transcriptional regulator